MGEGVRRERPLGSRGPHGGSWHALTEGGGGGPVNRTQGQNQIICSGYQPITSRQNLQRVHQLYYP
jgi:hypothetical protein